MRKFCVLLVVVAMAVAVLGVAAPAMAVKPDWNLAAAEKVDWNLSGNVMPVPPYGSRDVPGSDIASKLIVNQPNGAVEVVMTGEMKGLLPNTTHTVYLARGYAPFTSYPGLFTATVQPFTFVTDEFGEGCWHLSLRDENFPTDGAFNLSVWINESGKTILISDVFTVVK